MTVTVVGVERMEKVKRIMEAASGRRRWHFRRRKGRCRWLALVLLVAALAVKKLMLRMMLEEVVLLGSVVVVGVVRGW